MNPDSLADCHIGGTNDPLVMAKLLLRLRQRSTKKSVFSTLLLVPSTAHVGNHFKKSLGLSTHLLSRAIAYLFDSNLNDSVGICYAGP
jgi:hypothetical protein